MELDSNCAVGSPEDWLHALEGQVATGFAPLLGRMTPEAAAVEWIQETQGALLGKAGDTASARSLFERIGDEVTAFVCGDARYAAERERLAGASEAGKPVVVSAVATAVAHVLGLSFGVVIAPVAVILYLIAKIGRNAWCRGVRPDGSSTALADGAEV